MKREIKFRAWHIAEKKMCEISVMTFGEGAFLVGVEKKPDYIQGNHFIHTPEEGRFCFNSEFELIQFTGLKEKNGIDIYEGDILNKKTTFEDNMSDRRFQPNTEILVDFENGCFIDSYTHVPLSEKMQIISSYSQKNWTNYEYIGNIYENPELL